MALTHTVVLSKERLHELYGPLGRATPTLRDPNQLTFKTMAKWCDENVGRYEILRPSTWVFESEDDAVLFKLVWA